jgi:hypothetical protein
MSYDDDWPDQTWENRRAMVVKTIRPATLGELKKMGEELFPVVSDPWCLRYFEFLNTHPDSRYYHAQIPGHAEIVYCGDSDRGMWFVPGKSMGVIQSKGLEILAQIVAKL